MALEILYRDEDLIAINKPHGLLVHQSGIAADVSEFAVQLLRDQTGSWVYPAHRLDRKTSGVLLFTLNPETNPIMQKMFAERKVSKKYLAIVRGFTPEQGKIDDPLKKESGMMQRALTYFKTIARAEIDVPFGKHPTSRYSLVELQPQTGRRHQLRRHMAHISHPIIGDRPHGCNKQNRLWKEKWGMTTMLLHARSLEFIHPKTGENVSIEAGLQLAFSTVKKMLFDRANY